MHNSLQVINRVSRLFQPINAVQKNVQIKNQDVSSKSQRLMLELGIIRQANPGSFHLLPLGVRALEKLIKLVDTEMYRIGAQKVVFPTLTNSSLWKATGRLEEVGPELFTVHDRHQKSYILSPTHEEAASDLLASVAPLSYKHFPLRLYQITSKYRDEMKPRFGLMRGRQFIMKDLYSFDVDVESAKQSYKEVCKSYDIIFKKIGIDFVRVLAASGNMGGSMSHEYHYMAPVGEDDILLCSDCGYSANVEVSGAKSCPLCGKTERLKITPAIEVGHTFLLGDKYSTPLNATYLSEKAKPVSLQMGSYGLGLTRILAAAIEVMSLENHIRWPNILAPYSVIIIPPKHGSKEEPQTINMGEKLYALLESIPALQGNILLDDRTHMTIGRRLLDAQRVGYPYIIVVGPKATENPPLYELNDINNEKQSFFNETDVLNYIKNGLVC